VQHRAAPEDGRVVGDEHADGDDLHVVRDGREDHPLDLGRPAGDAEHPWHRVPVDVRVDDPHLEPGPCHRGGQVDGHRGLADAALARCDREHAGEGVGLRERDLLVGLPTPQLPLQCLALLGAHHVELDLDAGHPGDALDRRGHLAGDLVAHRAAGDRQEHLDPDLAARLDPHRLDHAQLGDRPADLRVVHGGQCGVHQIGRRGGGHASMLRRGWARQVRPVSPP
jgi:hypothetical protein